MMAAIVYLLCALTSAFCATLLLVSYRRGRVPLILWTSVCFIALAINNALLFVDLVVILGVDLRIWRNLSAVAAVALLLYGMIREEVTNT